MHIRLRPAQSTDVDFARSLYFETMRDVIEPWNEQRQEESFAKLFDLRQASIISVKGKDVGWMQVHAEPGQILLRSLYLEPSMQRRGIGTRILGSLIAQCEKSSKRLRIAVIKNNRAMGLYHRLGFRIITGDDHKFYMEA
jgi:GNAT superfamily N-acetyltransferase